MTTQSTINNVIENVATLPKLATGAATSIIGAITGTESPPNIQIWVWGASILAALVTAALGIVRIYIEIKKAKKEKIFD